MVEPATTISSLVGPRVIHVIPLESSHRSRTFCAKYLCPVELRKYGAIG